MKPISTTLQANREIREIPEIEDSETNISLAFPNFEEDFPNPSVIVNSENREKNLQDLQEGAGVDNSDGLPNVAYCNKRISTIESNRRAGKVSDKTYEKALNRWNEELSKAKAREGLKK